MIVYLNIYLLIFFVNRYEIRKLKPPLSLFLEKRRLPPLYSLIKAM